MRVFLALLAVGLLIYAVIDCTRTPDTSVPSALPRAGWYAVMLLLPILGPIFWIIASRTEDGSHDRGNPGGSPSRGPRRPLGPDDDPDFLHGL